MCLESILWNKVPVELQREVKEITTEGSVHELLQKLLRLEAMIQERARQEKAEGNEPTTASGMSQGSHSIEGTQIPHPQISHRSQPRVGIPQGRWNQK